MTATGVSASVIVTGWSGVTATAWAPCGSVSVTVHSAPSGNGPTVADRSSGAVRFTVAGSKPATGFPANVQSTSTVYTVPSGTNWAPEPTSTFDTVNSPVWKVLVTVTSTGPWSGPTTEMGSAGSITTSDAP